MTYYPVQELTMNDTEFDPHRRGEYLIKHKWKKVEGRFKDPKTGKFYTASHAVIIQEDRDADVMEVEQRKIAVQMQKSAEEFSKWSMYEHSVDEMLPPEPVKRKKRRSK